MKDKFDWLVHMKDHLEMVQQMKDIDYVPIESNSVDNRNNHLDHYSKLMTISNRYIDLYLNKSMDFHIKYSQNMFH